MTKPHSPQDKGASSLREDRAAAADAVEPVVSSKAGIPCAGGFGERTFSADGRLIRVEPKEVSKENGRTNITLGFPFATLEEYVDPASIADDLADYLSCPKRAAAPELYRDLATALTLIRISYGNQDEGVNDFIARADASLAKARGQQ
jgi:hypothetical protein